MKGFEAIDPSGRVLPALIWYFSRSRSSQMLGIIITHSQYSIHEQSYLQAVDGDDLMYEGKITRLMMFDRQSHGTRGNGVGLIYPFYGVRRQAFSCLPHAASRALR